MKEASSNDYKFIFVKRLRNFLVRNDKIKTAIVLNFNRRLNMFNVEKSLNHLHGCVNRKLLTKKKWRHDNNRVKFYGFVEQGVNQTHINLLIDTVKHKFETVMNLINEFWNKITKQTKQSAIYEDNIKSKSKWVRYATKDLNKSLDNFLAYY